MSGADPGQRNVFYVREHGRVEADSVVSQRHLMDIWDRFLRRVGVFTRISRVFAGPGGFVVTRQSTRDALGYGARVPDIWFATEEEAHAAVAMYVSQAKARYTRLHKGRQAVSPRRCDHLRCTAAATDRTERVNGKGWAIEMLCESHADEALRAGTHVITSGYRVTVPSFRPYDTTCLVTAIAVADEFRLLGFTPEVRSDL